MEKEKFRLHLDKATKALIDFTKSLCYNEFAANYRYITEPCSRTIAPEDKHLDMKEHAVLADWNTYRDELLTAGKVIELLHHNNRVPVYIDMYVYETKPSLTVIKLNCSRRLREEKDLMHPGFPPFHLQVATPIDSLKIEKDGKFDVNWKKRWDDKCKPKNVLVWLKHRLLKPFLK